MEATFKKIRGKIHIMLHSFVLFFVSQDEGFNYLHLDYFSFAPILRLSWLKWY